LQCAFQRNVQLLFSLFRRNNVDNLATLALTELHTAIGEGEQSVVLANANVLAWVCTSATLTNDDGAGADDSSVEYLDAKALCI
jgi:hypothetical protein